MGAGRKIIESLEQAVRGDFSRVTVMGQTWVRLDQISTIEDAIRVITRDEMGRCGVLVDRSDDV